MSWKYTSALPVGLQAIALASDGRYLFTVGGMGYDTNGDQFFSDKVYAARISASGALESWFVAGTLPEGVWDGSAVVYNGYLYVVGGATVTEFDGAPNLWVARIEPSGVLTPWSVQGLPVGRRSTGLAVHGDRLYIVGGVGPETGNADVGMIVGRLAANGAVERLTVHYATLPDSTLYNHTTILNGTMYVMGDGTEKLSWSKLNADGLPARWRTVSLPVYRVGGNLVSQGTSLYYLAGYHSSQGATVLRATVEADGTPGPLYQTSNYRIPGEGIFRDFYPTGIVVAGALYVMGGEAIAGTPQQDAVQFAKIGADGLVGGERSPISPSDY